ncbi:hypothetical protein EIP86_010422 [Pleurotus ostreatoroseus]|nr:hypothetical protein EIP86_010422 [Pleurotus ostreatoroseus]
MDEVPLGAVFTKLTLSSKAEVEKLEISVYFGPASDEHLEEGLPSVSSILDDHRSIFSSNEMRKEGRDQESRSSQESPQQAGESETTLECISKERAEGVTQDSQASILPEAASDAPDVIMMAPRAQPLDPPEIPVLPPGPPCSLPYPPSTAPLLVPAASNLNLTSSASGSSSASVSQSPKRSWFMSFSRSRGKEVLPVQTVQENTETEHSGVEASKSPIPSPTLTPGAEPQARVEPTDASAKPDTNEGASTPPPPVLTTSSSVDDEVPPLPATPQTGSGEDSSSSDVNQDTAILSQELSQRERALSVSSLNPSTSRFMLRLPLLGRPKVPLDQAITQCPKAEDRDPQISRALVDSRKGELPIQTAAGVGEIEFQRVRSEMTMILPYALPDMQVKQEPQSPEIPEVKVVVPSPPQSSETLADTVLSAASQADDLKPIETQQPSPPTSSPQLEAPSSESTPQIQSNVISEGHTPVASSSSWWGYIGWGGSTASVSALEERQHVSSSHVEESPIADTGKPTESVATEIPSLDSSPTTTEQHSPSPNMEVSADTAGSPQVEGSTGEPTTTQENNPEPMAQPQAASVTSAETSKSQPSAWYSPWAWYASSPVAPQGADSYTPRPENDASEPSPSKTESELVKEEALARDSSETTAASTEAPVSDDKLPPEEAQPSQETSSSSALPLSASNPIEASISTDRSGWTSFFVSKALSMKGVWDTDANKLKDRPESSSGMEVMDIDDEEDDPGTGVDDSENATRPSASKAIAILPGSKPNSPTSATTPSISPRTSMSPKECEPRKPGPPAAPLTNSETLKKETMKRSASPAPSTSTSTSKKPTSGTSTPQPKVSPPNLVLPTWKDTFLSPPRSTIPPPPSPPSTQRGRLGKTLEVMSHMLFPDAGKAKAKGKERARSWDRERDRREQELLTFGSELPKALEVLGQTFDVDSYNEHCRVAVIGVAGWSPGAVTRTIAGGLPSSSSKFVNMTCAALERFEQEHGFKFKKVTGMALEGDGTIERKVSNDWMDDLHSADVIFVAAHSQGCIVATHLLDKLIREGHISTPRNAEIVASTAAAVAPGGSVPISGIRTQKICCLSLCGIHLGPLRYLKTSSLLQPYIQYFENAAARELFDFQNTESTASKNYVQALRTVMDHGAKMVYVASLNDQVVPIYSGLFTAASHPRILRALYIDGDAYHSSDFLSNLLVLLIRIMNSGMSDSGLLTHLSEATAGTLSGVGHSTAYEELATYSDGPDIRNDLSVETFNAVNEQNDYEIPWSLRDLIADDYVAHFFAHEFSQLRDAFDEWSPKTSILRDVKRKLQPIQRLSSIKGKPYTSRL